MFTDKHVPTDGCTNTIQVVVNHGPVVQSIVSLTSSLVVKMLFVLVSTIFNSHVLLLKKNVSSFCKCKNAKATNIFSTKCHIE